MAKNDLQPLSRYVTRGLYGIGAENVGAPPVRLGAAEGEPKALNAFFSMQLAWPATAAERHAMLPVRRASHPASWASSTRPPSLTGTLARLLTSHFNISKRERGPTTSLQCKAPHCQKFAMLREIDDHFKVSTIVREYLKYLCEC